ncbi:tetraspanin-1 [Tetranychus urticae]|uniref:Tetraspanin n=1 Tax=Tetranychus urticae TaxID=32264 RepID=T1KQB1_TETUR|nr:tetraspanin-1 [Tetranychus urticae]
MGYSVQYFSCVKIFLVFFNFLLWCSGMTLIGIGLWFRIDPKMYEPTLYIDTENFINVGWIMMFSGLAIVIISIIGCIGTLTNSTCKLGTYIFIMALLIGLAIACVVLAATHGFGERLEYYVTQQVLIQIQQRPFSERARELLDFIQVKLKCCGAENFNDYHRYGLEVPVSCYREQANFINQEGCGRVLGRFYDLRGGLALGLNAFTVIIEFLCLIFALSLFCVIRLSDLDD